MTDGLFSVLVLCTANICRSPVAAAFLRAGLGADADVRVSSAGLRVRAGDTACPTMAAVTGVPPAGGTARQVGPALLHDADLVLTMTRAHRAAAVDLAPAAVRRTFTVREFADLALLVPEETDLAAAASPSGRLAALVAAAPRFRAHRVAGEHDDIADPHGRELAEYERAAAALRGAMSVVGRLAGGRTAIGGDSASSRT